MKYVTILASIILLVHCTNEDKKRINPAKVYVVGAMKKTMWNGELDAKIKFDSLQKQKGVYGIGPLSHLKGEVLILNSDVFVSRVLNDSLMSISKNESASSPFFVYSKVNKWSKKHLPDSIVSIPQLETYLDDLFSGQEYPIVFKLEGSVYTANIHIQNLPDGVEVSSPKEAHQGQTDYSLKDENVAILGFYSKKHKGIFTHHDSNIHMHLITDDHLKMGHLDQVEFDEIHLFVGMNK